MALNYSLYGNKNGQPVILLHGWGQNLQMMDPLGLGLRDDYHVLTVDLPGFGASKAPKEAWFVKDYVTALHELVKELQLKNPIIIGHSFGGRVAIKYAATYQISKLVLLAAPFRPYITKETLKTRFLKFAKKIPVLNLLEDFAKNHFGSEDYRKATPIMKDILVNIIKEDLTEDVKKIKIPVILIYSPQDEAVPYSEALELEVLFKNAGLIKYEGNTHYGYLERLDQTINICKNFFNGGKK